MEEISEGRERRENDNSLSLDRRINNFHKNNLCCTTNIETMTTTMTSTIPTCLTHQVGSSRSISQLMYNEVAPLYH